MTVCSTSIDSAERVAGNVFDAFESLRSDGSCPHCAARIIMLSVFKYAAEAGLDPEDLTAIFARALGDVFAEVSVTIEGVEDDSKRLN